MALDGDGDGDVGPVSGYKLISMSLFVATLQTEMKSDQDVGRTVS